MSTLHRNFTKLAVSWLTLFHAFGMQAGNANASECEQPRAYLSDTSGAHRYLSWKQKSFYEANPSFSDPISEGAVKDPNFLNDWDKLGKALMEIGCGKGDSGCLLDRDLLKLLRTQLMCQDLPTRYESPLMAIALNISADQIETIRKTRKANPSEIAIGSLPTGRINAEVLPRPRGADYDVIILNRDVYSVTGAFSKSVSNAIPISTKNGRIALSYDVEAIRTRLGENPQIVNDFAEAVLRLMLTGSSAGANEVLLDADHSRLHARLVSALDFFYSGARSWSCRLKTRWSSAPPKNAWRSI